MVEDSGNGSSQIQSGTAEGEFQFLDYIVAKGYGTPAAVTPWKSAARQVYKTVEGNEDFDRIKVRELAIDDYLDRFETKARGEYKHESIQAYRKRFTHAYQAYLAFLDTGKAPTFRSGSRRRTDAKVSSPPKAAFSPASAPVTPAAVASSTERMIEYPFPLRSGQVAILRLPVRFEKPDAERMAAFIRTLVFEPMLELGTGNE